MLQAPNLDLIQTKNETQNPLRSTTSRQQNKQQEKEGVALIPSAAPPVLSLAVEEHIDFFVPLQIFRFDREE